MSERLEVGRTDRRSASGESGCVVGCAGVATRGRRGGLRNELPSRSRTWQWWSSPRSLPGHLAVSRRCGQRARCLSAGAGDDGGLPAREPRFGLDCIPATSCAERGGLGVERAVGVGEHCDLKRPCRRGSNTPTSDTVARGSERAARRSCPREPRAERRRQSSRRCRAYARCSNKFGGDMRVTACRPRPAAPTSRRPRGADLDDDCALDLAAVAASRLTEIAVT